MNAWLPQASYPCGNFSDTSSVNIRLTKGSLDHSFEARIHTENTGQTSICSYAPREISVLTELILGHLCYCLTDVPPQPNSPPDNVFHLDRKCLMLEGGQSPLLHHGISKTRQRVVVFHCRRSSHLCYTPKLISQSQTRVKLNRVFFPR